MRTEDDLPNNDGPSFFERVIAASLRNRLLVIIASALLVVAGIRAATRLPIDAVPDVTNVQVQILTDAPGLSPLEVEQLVTRPVEQSMSGLPKLEELRSLSRFGLSVVTVVFDEGTDIYWARQVVGERLTEARESIPEGYGEPEIGPISSGLGEIFQFEVRAENPCPAGEDNLECWSLMELRDVLEWQVAPQIRKVTGVVELNAFGGELRTYEVAVRPEALDARKLVLSDLFEALESNNVNVGGGYIARDREQMLIRGTSQLQTLEDVGAVVVATTEEGTPILVRDVGTVGYAPLIRQGAVTRDARGEVVTGIAMMALGENSRVVAQRLREAVEEIEPSLPDGVRIDVFYDRTELVDRTIQTVGKNLLEGGILVIVVLLLLLGNLRGGLVVASAIPLSMLFAVIGMQLAGVSGNLMSLGAIDFGLIVDGSVVMIENVLRVTGDRRSRGEKVGVGTVFHAAREVARPVAFAVGIIILVYLPLLALTGIEGKMFRPMAMTVVFALVGSLIVAMTVMPVLASIFLTNAKEHHTWLMRMAHRVYEPQLDRLMRRPHLTGVVAALTFAASLLLLPFMGAEFVPKLDEGAIALQIIRPPSVSLEQSIRQAGQTEAALIRAFPDEVDTVVSKTGRAEIATDPMGVDFSDVFVMLKPPSEWTTTEDKTELVELMQEELVRTVPGANFAFSQPIELRMNELIEGVRSDVAIIVSGEDLNELDRIGNAIAGAVQGVEGAADVKVEKVAGLPMMTIAVDRAAVSRLGMNATDVLDAVQALRGRPAGIVLQGERRYQLQVRFPKEIREDPDRIARLLVGRAGGPRVPLGQVAIIHEEEGPLQISRADVQRRLTVEVNVRGRDVAGFVADAKQRIADEVDVPSGYVVEWGGTFENLEAASARLAIVVPLVLLLIFVLLQANFGSTRVTLLVYANVPLAVTGGLVALFLRGLPLSISAGVGFIALFGIAVMNGVVLVSSIRDRHVPGVTAAEAARAGAHVRLRPVLMTALVAALGFVPMALAHSAGAEVQRPLATVVIGGLFTSTLLTLIVLPTLYGRWVPDPVREDDELSEPVIP